MILSLQSFEPAPTQSKPGRRILQATVSLEQPTHRSGGNPQLFADLARRPALLVELRQLLPVYLCSAKTRAYEESIVCHLNS
jgi:hypothetical protein